MATGNSSAYPYDPNKPSTSQNYDHHQRPAQRMQNPYLQQQGQVARYHYAATSYGNPMQPRMNYRGSDQGAWQRNPYNGGPFGMYQSQVQQNIRGQSRGQSRGQQHVNTPSTVQQKIPCTTQVRTEEQNYFRLTGLLGIGVKSIKERFTVEINTNYGCLADALVQKKEMINALLTDKFIEPRHYYKLYSNEPVNVCVMDLPLLVKLYEHVLRSTMDKKWPSNGLEKTMDKLRSIRHTLSHDYPEFKVPDQQYETLKVKLEFCLKCLNYNQSEIDRMLHRVIIDQEILQVFKSSRELKHEYIEERLDEVIKLLQNVKPNMNEKNEQEEGQFSDSDGDETKSRGKKRKLLNISDTSYIQGYQWQTSVKCTYETQEKQQFWMFGYKKEENVMISSTLESSQILGQISISHYDKEDNDRQKFLDTTPIDIIRVTGGCLQYKPTTIISKPCTYFDWNDIESVSAELAISFLKPIEADIISGQKFRNIMMKDNDHWCLLYADGQIVPLAQDDKDDIINIKTSSAFKLVSGNISRVLTYLEHMERNELLKKAWEECVFTQEETDTLTTDIRKKYTFPRNFEDMLKTKSHDVLMKCARIFKKHLNTYVVGCLLEYVLNNCQKGKGKRKESEGKQIVKYILLKVADNPTKVDVKALDAAYEFFTANPEATRKATRLEVSNIKKECIKMNVEIDSKTEYANIVADIECGLFLERCCLLLKKNGQELLTGKIIIKAVYGEESFEKEFELHDNLQIDSETEEFVNYMYVDQKEVKINKKKEQDLKFLAKLADQEEEDRVLQTARREKEAMDARWMKQKKMGNASSYLSTSSHKPVMVAAIDFGTTYSGYAFAFNDEPNNIILNRNWGSELGTASLKTPTSVLMNQKGEFVSFGYKAEKDYADFCTDEKKEQYELFRHFKMSLYKETDLKRSTMVKSVQGKEYSIMKLTEYALRYLKEHLLDAVSEFRKPDVRRIMWVITVPAIWDENAKQFMREAAVQAGLIEQKYSKHLVLALEPEAASVFCRRLNVYDFNKELPIQREVKFVTGTKYLIADIGGGTLDITAHEIQNENELVEIISANGGDLGGMKVNYNFESLLMYILGQDFVLYLQKMHPSQWLEIMMEYEYKKIDVKALDNEGIGFEVSMFLKTEYKEFTGNNLEDIINNSSLQGVRYDKGIIHIMPVYVEKLFDPVIENIIECMEEALENEALQDLQYLILVGGFSESSYLLHKIRKAFSNRCSIISPTASNSVIMKGAVLFGQKPSTIVSRICRKTYGIGIPEGESGESEKFEPFVLKGERVPLNTFKTYAFTSDKKHISVSIYCSDRTDVNYTDEEGVTKIDELSPKKPLLMSLFSRTSERPIECKIYFGKTEVMVDQVDKKSHQTLKTSIDFLKE